MDVIVMKKLRLVSIAFITIAAVAILLAAPLAFGQGGMGPPPPVPSPGGGGTPPAPTPTTQPQSQQQPSITVTLPNPLSPKSDVCDLLKAIVRWLIKLGAPVAALMIIVGAFQMMTAGGSPEKLTTAKKTLLYTVIGYGIIIVSWGMTSVIADVLGAQGWVGC